MNSSPTDDERLSESSYVLDSSALLALALNEPGAEAVRQALAAGAALSTVNLTEILTRLLDLGGSVEQSSELVLALNPVVVEFGHLHASIAAGLRTHTRELGLSLGDRACLALATERGLPVLTADRVWAELHVGIDVRVIR